MKKMIILITLTAYLSGCSSYLEISGEKLKSRTYNKIHGIELKNKKVITFSENGGTYKKKKNLIKGDVENSIVNRYRLSNANYILINTDSSDFIDSVLPGLFRKSYKNQSKLYNYSIIYTSLKNGEEFYFKNNFAKLNFNNKTVDIISKSGVNMNLSLDSINQVNLYMPPSTTSIVLGVLGTVAVGLAVWAIVVFSDFEAGGFGGR